MSAYIFISNVTEEDQDFPFWGYIVKSISDLEAIAWFAEQSDAEEFIERKEQ